MARRKRKTGLDGLGDAFKTRKGQKSALESLGNATRRKRRKNRGLLAASGFGNKKGTGMLSTYNRYARKDRRRGLDNTAARAWRERMTRSEYLTIREEMDQTIRNDDGLTSDKEYNRLVENMPWYRRVLVLARKRFRKPVL